MMIGYGDFSKLELRVGTIKSCENIEGKDKLYLLKIDVNEDKDRTLLAGLKPYYAKEQLEGKQVVVLVNLEPKKMAGVLSEGMILAAVSEDYKTVRLLTPDDKIDAGTRVM